MRRSVVKRINQIVNWTLEEFPPPVPVRLAWMKASELPPKERDYAFCHRDSGKIVITLVRRSTSTVGELSDSWLHEYAHAITFRSEKWEVKTGFRGKLYPREIAPHDPVWALVYGALYERFIDLGGCEESRDYPDVL